MAQWIGRVPEVPGVLGSSPPGANFQNGQNGNNLENFQHQKVQRQHWDSNPRHPAWDSNLTPGVVSNNIKCQTNQIFAWWIGTKVKHKSRNTKLVSSNLSTVEKNRAYILLKILEIDSPLCTPPSLLRSNSPPPSGYRQAYTPTGCYVCDLASKNRTNCRKWI